MEGYRIGDILEEELVEKFITLSEKTPILVVGDESDNKSAVG